MRRLFKNKDITSSNLILRIAIGTVTCLAVVAVVQWERNPFETEFREGDIALRAMYAPYDFRIKGDIDNKTTEAVRKKAMDSVLPVYVFDSGAKINVLKKAASVIDSVRTLKNTPDLAEEQKASSIKESAASANISETLVMSILDMKDLDRFLAQANEIIDKYMSDSIISTSDKDSIRANNIKMVRLLDAISGTENIKSAEELYNLDDLRKKLDSYPFTVKDKKVKNTTIDLLNAILSINTAYDKEKTESEKKLASQAVVPIHNIIEIKKNEMILGKGERIGKEHVAKLKGIEENQLLAMNIKASGVFAIAILTGLFIVLVALYLRSYEPGISETNRELLLVSLISFLILLTAKIIVISPWPSSIIPFSVASMLIALLIESRVAIIVSFFLSILVGIIAGNRLDIMGMSFVGGMVGIFAMRGVRRRSQILTAGVSVGLANMSYLIGTGLLSSLDFSAYISESFFGLANGIMSAIILTGILPIFENAFKIPTDISLLELSDLNHPILKEMVIKAPGTYHHSLVVGNLAEAACEAIGANPLLARVGSYFHDIGKIEKAPYFSENQAIGESNHDRLSPTMSSLIITNHVKNGIEMAQKYKINDKIIDIIKQHHGTGLVFYFFKRALEKVPDEKIGEQSFRYPGPKPQTKEAACVLLADSVEAASRALDDPTPSRIKGLVRKIINNKFIDGQLDECDLTLKNLEKIAEMFTHILTGIFHTRVEYPEETRKEKA